MSIRAFIVDDEPIARHSIARLLRKEPEIAIAGEFGDGASALEAIRQLRPDLVFLDIQMPEMTGIDVLQALRAQPGPNRETPLIAVTADAMTLGAERYAELGFAGYVTKPVQVQNLVSAMMAAVANGDADEIAESA